MELKNVQENLSKLNFPKEQQNAVLHLIDIKIDNDMDKVLNKIDARFDAINAKFDAINAKFDGVNAKFDGVNAKFEGVNSELRRLEDKQDTKFTMVMWALGILIALILALKFIH